MATIQSSLALQDRMSSTLRTITVAMGSTLNAMRSIQGVQLGPEFARAAADIHLAERAVEELNNSINQMPSATSRAVGGFTVMGGTLAGLAARGLELVATGIKNFSTDMVSSAAKVKAETSMFAQTFRDFSDEATSAIKRVSDEGGILETRLNVVGSRIYSFAKSSGGTTAESMVLMETALKAASDSAAYYDKSLEETSDTLMSFLKGNYANDAALGVSATEFTRNQKAIKLFGVEYMKLSEIQKQQTLLKMVTDSQKISGAMGQAAREAEGWENVQGNLNESWRLFQAEAGEPVLEALIPIVQSATESIAFLKDNLDTIAPIVKALAAGIGAAAVAVGVYTAAQWLMNAALWANPMTWVVIGIVALVAGFVWLADAVGGFGILWEMTMDGVLLTWDALKWGFMVGIFWILDLWDSLDLGLRSVANGIQNIMGDMSAGTISILQDMVNGSLDIINSFISALNSVPGVELEMLEKVTFGTEAALQNEAERQAREKEMENFKKTIEGNRASRKAELDLMVTEGHQAHEERQRNISAMQADAAARKAEKKAEAPKTGASDFDDFGIETPGGKALKTKNVEPLLNDEDIKLLTDIATRDYKLEYQQLTPQISMQFGDINETADADNIISKLADVLEEMAISRLEVVN